MMEEDRKSDRKPVMKPVEFFLIPSIIGKTFDGLITDISNSGLCLLTATRLKDRQRIIIEDKSFPSEKVAIVRWTEKYDDTLYKIGLEFVEDKSFLNIKGKRRYRRLNIKNVNIKGRMALASSLKIIDMSLDGLSVETDKKVQVGKEYILHLEYEGKTWSIKGSIAWLALKQVDGNGKRDTVPVYRAGMKLANSSGVMRELIKSIETRKKKGEKQEYFSLSFDELDMHCEENEDLKTCLQSASK